MKTYKFSNKEIIQILKEVLASMEVKKYSFFEIRSYQNAIAILDNLTVSIQDLWENNQLDDVPSIGEMFIKHFDELFTQGSVEKWEKAKKDLPKGMFSLISLRGIGAKKAYKLAKKFKLEDKNTAIEELKKHAKTGEIKELPGFGEKSEKDILDAIEQTKMHKSEKQRTLLYKAEEIVERIKKYMQELDCVKEIEACGSFRRKNPTVGDLDIPVSTTDGKKTMDHFLKFSEIKDVLVRGDKRTSVVLKNDMQVDLYICDPNSYGSMLQYFTGSKQHNILLRTYALDKKKMSLSEYGIKYEGKLLEFASEREFYEKLDIKYIPPELREGGDEVELAVQNKIPHLIELKDIKGDLHIHTVASDGVNTLEEMVLACHELGYEYIGIADHNPSVRIRGQREVEAIVEKTRMDIGKISRKYNDIKILFGYEVDILADATLGLPDSILKKLDFAIAGIHTSLKQDRKEITKRLVSALESDYIHIISHPSGRLINEREAYDVDWDMVFNAAKANNKTLEINAFPQRLDLNYDLVKKAKDRGIKLIVNTDAHALDQLLFMRFGVYMAQKGWCEKENIINTSKYSEFVKKLGIK